MVDFMVVGWKLVVFVGKLFIKWVYFMFTYIYSVFSWMMSVHLYMIYEFQLINLTLNRNH